MFQTKVEEKIKNTYFMFNRSFPWKNMVRPQMTYIIQRNRFACWITMAAEHSRICKYFLLLCGSNGCTNEPQLLHLYEQHLSCLYSVPARKVNILGGHSIGNSKQKCL